MSLFGTLNIGQSAISAQQAALQVTGNNIANAGNADYTRETANLAPGADQKIGPGIFLGSGVDLTGIQRQIDDSLQSRLRSAQSDNQAATTSQNWLSQVETTFNALGTTNLSSRMGTFFSGWSTLANSPQDTGQRQVVLQNASTLANSLNDEQGQLTTLQNNTQQQINVDAQNATSLAAQVASLNGQIVQSGTGFTGQSNSLLDSRDAVLSKLSNLIGINTVQQPNGSINVYVGSQPIVLGTTSQTISLTQTVVNNVPVSSPIIRANGEPLNITSGELGSLQVVQKQIGDVTNQLNSLAHNLISAVNNIHASGQGTTGYSTVTGANAVLDPTVPLSSAASGLKFPPNNGSFVVHVTNKGTGLSTSTLVQVNLTGSPTDTTLNSLAASLNGVAGVTASISGGKLTIASNNADSTISFSQDSSSTLAGLGINTFFSGSDASDIAVNQTVQNDPTLIAAAQNGDPGDNQTALAIAALQTQPLPQANGSTLINQYQNMINGVAGEVSTANTNATAAKAVQDTLTSQRQSLSGVSINEEAIHMIQQQTAFQGAARLISTVTTLMQALLAIPI